MIGAAVGGGTALWQLGARAVGVTAVEGWTERLARSQGPLRRYRVGPHQHPNFPFVLLDRALLHHEAIRYRAHALNAAGELSLPSGTSRTRDLPAVTRQRLSKLLLRCRKSPGADHTRTQAELAELLEALLRQRDTELTA